MCWVCKTEKVVKQVATENIPIFKSVSCPSRDRNCYRSRFRLFDYTLNKKYSLEHPIEVDLREKVSYISEGFHSYTLKTISEVSIYYSLTSCDISYYSLRVCDVFRINIDNEYTYLVVGYIPKGTVYYEDEYGEVVSESIVLTERVEDVQSFCQQSKGVKVNQLNRSRK